MPKGQRLRSWFPGSITTSKHQLHFWETMVPEMKRNTFLLTPQTPWSRGKGFYNPPLGLQWRETFRPRGSTSRSTSSHLGRGSPAVNGAGPASAGSARFLETKRSLGDQSPSEGLRTGPGPLETAASRRPPPEVAPGGHGKGRGDGRCHTQLLPGCSRGAFWLFSHRWLGEKPAAQISLLPSAAEPPKSSRCRSRVRASRLCSLPPEVRQGPPWNSPRSSRPAPDRRWDARRWEWPGPRVLGPRGRPGVPGLGFPPASVFGSGTRVAGRGGPAGSQRAHSPRPASPLARKNLQFGVFRPSSGHGGARCLRAPWRPLGLQLTSLIPRSEPSLLCIELREIVWRSRECSGEAAWVVGESARVQTSRAWHPD